MATYVPYTPTSIIEKALFNLDAFGMSNYRISGTVGVSVSDSFTQAQYAASSPPISEDIYTSLGSGSGDWTTAQLANIDLITATYSKFIDLRFSPVVNDSGATPAKVGNGSDINISFIYRTDWSYAGQSGGGVDTNFGYPGSHGDIVLNWNGFGAAGLNNDKSLSASSYGFHALMHEIGHSLGLSHPQRTIINGVPSITTDFAATTTLGFDKLGFQTASPLDMNKEYFTVMSYDDQQVAGEPDTFAQTPMILDVIALQGAYGAGAGTSGTGDDILVPGGKGGVASYRTYFDSGGSDAIDLSNYASGAYLHMGAPISGAAHRVGVSMSTADENKMVVLQRDPASLRWFYGEYENASGSAGGDHIVGNSLDNAINGQSGDDTVNGGAGNDTLDGGSGMDTAAFSGNLANYRLTRNGAAYSIRDNAGTDGADSLAHIERLQFSDTKLALDMEVTQAGGEAALLIGAVLGKASLSAKTLVGQSLEYFDAGHSMLDAANTLVGSGIIDRLANGSNTGAFVSLIYHSVTGQDPAAKDTQDLAALIDGGTYTKAGFLAAAALHLENQVNVGLVGLLQTGLEYS